MKSVTKLKDDARKHEQREEWDKAIQAYLQVLKIGEEGEGELDLPLYNRVGDLYLRLSKPNDAVKYYVQAADRYAEAGLFNNAIALCNKALRYVPQQLDLLRKLGQFSASQGFLTDARRYFLEFAEKKFAGGQVDEALTALEEFADASDDPEIRVMLARQLQAHGRTNEAVNELRKAHGVHTRNGASDAAAALYHEIETLSPGAMSADRPLDTSFTDAAPADAADDDYAFSIDSGADQSGDSGAGGFSDPSGSDDAGLADIAVGGLEGFESDHFEIVTPAEPEDMELQGFETTHAQEPTFEIAGFDDADDDLGLEPTTFEAPADVDAEPLPGLEFDESSFGDGAFDDPDAVIGDDDPAFDLPLLSADGEDEQEFSFDGEGETGKFDMPTFEIEIPNEMDSSSAEGDGYFDDSEPALELPSLGGNAFGDAVFEDAPASGAAARISPDMDFGEYGSEPPSVVMGRHDEAAGLEESLAMNAEAPSLEDEEAAEFVEELVAESESSTAGVTEDVRQDAVSRNGEREASPWDAGDQSPEISAPRPPKPSRSRVPEGGFVDLGALIAEDDDDEETDTRFVVQEKAPTGDEDRDFAELLSQFRQKVSENVSTEDSAAHYDLGLAFKEMGLVDEAIGEFQIAMRSGDMRLRVYEELGQCFLMKDQHNIAEKVLRRALEMKGPGGDIEMIGVYYHLGRAYEGLGNREAARDAYERVLGIDVNFQDVTARLARL